jgi:hypothetical protein
VQRHRELLVRHGASLGHLPVTYGTVT